MYFSKISGIWSTLTADANVLRPDSNSACRSARQFSYTIVLLLWRVSKQKFVWKIAFLRTSKAAAELRPSSSQSQGNAILKVNNFSAETEKETTMDFCLHWSQKVKKWKPTCHKSSLAQLQSVVMPFAVFTTFVDDDEHLATDLFFTVFYVSGFWSSVRWWSNMIPLDPFM